LKRCSALFGMCDQSSEAGIAMKCLKIGICSNVPVAQRWIAAVKDLTQVSDCLVALALAGFGGRQVVESRYRIKVVWSQLAAIDADQILQ
jgi:uncharacterized protein (UPF0128 family)